jgi:hypothetical protein
MLEIRRCSILPRPLAESAALLVDEVFPEQPVRQWVLSVPYPLRFVFASRPDTGVAAEKDVAVQIEAERGLHLTIEPMRERDELEPPCQAPAGAPPAPRRWDERAWVLRFTQCVEYFYSRY